MKILPAVLLVGALVLGGCGSDGGANEVALLDSASSAPALPALESPDQTVEEALERVGLEVCKRYDNGSNISGAYEGVSWHVGTIERPCEPGESAGYVSLDLYNNPGTASAELASPTGDAYITWLIDPTSLVSTIESTRPEVLDALTEAFAGYPSGPAG